MIEPRTLDCGHTTDCWCGQCHVCDDVTQDDEIDDREGDE